MIDWDKLREAHELCSKTTKYVFKCTFGYNCPYLYDLELSRCFEIVQRFSCIDELIDKLRELTAPEPKYKPGGVVYFLNDGNEIDSIIIEQARGVEVINYISEKYLPIQEKYLYATKDDLIQAQIEHWQSLVDQPVLTDDGSEANICLSMIHKDSHANDAVSYLTPKFEGEVNGFDSTCNYESDSYSYITQHKPQQNSKKCIKCGYLYR